MTESAYRLIDSEKELQTLIRDLKNTHGPIGIDTERAQSYRYSGRAYLIQLNREGLGTVLLDPLGCGDLSELNEVISTVPWIGHDISQDLPCLRDAGLDPFSLFDTEIAYQMLGAEHYGLAAACADLLGIELAKEFSAVDWSRRPLPGQWLEYAAADVDHLIPLYRQLAARLLEAGKDDWAVQEFEHLRSATPPEPVAEPWRELRGAGKIRSGRKLALLRELWSVREELGREADLAPSKIISNRNLVILADSEPRNRRQLLRLPFMRIPAARAASKEFALACVRVFEADPSTYPVAKKSRRAASSTANWRQTNAEAAQRLAAIRQVVSKQASRVEVLEQLLFPAAKRRELALDPSLVNDDLVSLGLRPWQRQILAAALKKALSGL